MTGDYMVIITYGFLVILCLRNVWVILIRQKEYQNLPILTFYAFAIIAVTLRPIYIIWYWDVNLQGVMTNMTLIQEAAKFFVGVVQDWITLELAIRIRNAKGYSDISAIAIQKLRLWRKLLFSFITLAFVAFSVTVIVSAHLEGNDGFAFYDNQNYCMVAKVIGYAFLVNMLAMILLVTWLFVETQGAVNRDKM